MKKGFITPGVILVLALLSALPILHVLNQEEPPVEQVEQV